MTTTRYFIARFAQAFGIFRRNQRMGDAASEMHLLREAEAHLGREVWEKVDSIEKLSIEYWNLRKLTKEHETVSDRLAQCEKRLEAAHEERSNLLSSSPALQPELFEERLAVLAKLESLSHQRDEIVTNARGIRRIYDGLRIKLEILSRDQLTNSASSDDLEHVKRRLTELQQQFVGYKEARTTVGTEIEALEKTLDTIDVDLEAMRVERRVQASAAFQVIAEVNKEVSTYRAEIGLLDTRMRQLYSEIGRYVSRNAYIDKPCAETVQTQRPLVDVMRALRRSVALNHRLAGMS
ncbi:MAG: hypothetical protein NTW21_20165 [Verrucomicrobia bacterium]|nr:hypothetical protein [Verrucomicrobiota bacterium]